jgi:glycosyltransferase involved in cell wall biosynthesis
MSGSGSGPLRVTFLDAYFGEFGGSHRVISQLAVELMNRNVAVSALTPGAGPFTERLEALGVPWQTLQLPDSLLVYGRATTGHRATLAALALPAVAVKLARSLRSTTDVLHANDLRGILLSGPGARLARVPAVWHMHAAMPNPRLNRIAKSLSRAVVVPSIATQATVPGLRPRDSVVIPNGVSQEVFAAVAEPAGDPLVVTASRLHPDKGLETLLRAFPTVRSVIPTARLMIFGGPASGYDGYASALTGLAADLAISDAVTMRGDVRDPFRLWSDAALYVQPSITESFGIGALEAMATGLPVVASRVGGLEALVSDGVTGVLVPPGDSSALAAAIVKVLLDADRASLMGKAGRDKAAPMSIASIADRFMTLYGEVVSAAH